MNTNPIAIKRKHFSYNSFLRLQNKIKTSTMPKPIKVIVGFFIIVSLYLNLSAFRHIYIWIDEPDFNENYILNISLTKNLVLDVGSSNGGSMHFIENALKRELGKNKINELNPFVLGLDNHPEKVKTCKESVASKNLDCIEQDILAFSNEQIAKISNGKVKGITAWHVMEHMPDCHVAKQIWGKVSRIAQNFISFRGPAFDDEDILHESGFLRYYENWTGHPCHFNSTMLKDSIIESSKSKISTSHIIINHKPMYSSRSNVILPVGSANDSHHYNPKIHPPKNIHNFKNVLHEEMRACVIYDDITQQKLIHIYSALCLKDALSANNNPKIISCSVPGIDSNNECLAYLKRRANQAIIASKKLYTS